MRGLHLTEHTTTECLLFPDIFDRPVVAKFDQRQGSSDGGAVLLKAANQRLGLTSALAACLKEERQPGKILHEIEELLTQRVMGMALGYEDANDAARLAGDPVHKLLVGRDPIDGEDLASQPTLSRFENAPDRKELLRLGNVSGACGAIGILRRLLRRLDVAFPGVVFRVRLDGGFAAPEVLEFLDRQPRVEYVVNLASNAVLDRLVEPAMRTARRLSKKSGETEHVYGQFRYKTKKTWKYKRRILYKAEVTRHPNRDPKDNPRFVVTNMKQSPQWLYEEVYCQRGDLENRIKELHYGMEIGRTSCTSFWANQFRVLMTAAAYVLMQELRLRLARTDCARAQVSTLRERFLKLGVQVVASVRRIVLHLPQAFPYCDHFYRLALSLGAQTG